jgi:hypothetical protein
MAADSVSAEIVRLEEMNELAVLLSNQLRDQLDDADQRGADGQVPGANLRASPTPAAARSPSGPKRRVRARRSA